MYELDLKEILWMLHYRVAQLEMDNKYTIDSNFIKKSDQYITEILNTIKEGE